MLYIVTYFEVQPHLSAQAPSIIEDYRAACAGSSGAVHAEALRERARGNRFVVLETWTGEEALQAHEGSERMLQLTQRLGPLQTAPPDRRVHQGFALTPAGRIVDAGGLFVVTHIDVPPPRKDETEVLLKQISVRALDDPGNRRYDVLQQTSRPNHFTTVSAWENEAAFAAHTAAAHTLEFRRTLAPMSGGLYDERLYGILS